MNFIKKMLPVAGLCAAGVLAALFVTAAPVMADGFTGPGAEKGGFSGPGPKAITVKEAKNLADDTKVTLRGYIIESLGGDHYRFKDSTDTIMVDIDDKRWRGQSVSPTDLVEIYGEVDKDRKGVEIDVKIIKKQ